MKIDLNVDLGEGCNYDEALLAQVSSANVACGWHAGDAGTMQQVVRWALACGVAIGAHPSFPDRENFGRTEMQLPLDDIRAGMLYQIGALAAIVRAQGGWLSHVKPHGALYNQAARDPALAETIVEAIRAPAGNQFSLGVQWHPEWRPLNNPASIALFRRFGDAARNRTAKGQAA